jgi:hypothetical protein
MLYSNSKHDVSELVLNDIVKDRKKQTLEDNKQARINKTTQTDPGIDETKSADDIEELDTYTEDEIEDGEALEKTPEQIKIEEKAAKQAELKARIKEQQEAREKLRDSLKRVAEEKRAAKLKEIEERNKQREELKKNNN